MSSCPKLIIRIEHCHSAVQPVYGDTAFHLAYGGNQPECAAALAELGCDTAIKAKNGRTGKQLAEDQGHAAVLDVLLVRVAVAARLRVAVAVDQSAAGAIRIIAQKAV
jgi:hypothetical protein